MGILVSIGGGWQGRLHVDILCTVELVRKFGLNPVIPLGMWLLLASVNWEQSSSPSYKD